MLREHVLSPDVKEVGCLQNYVFQPGVNNDNFLFMVHQSISAHALQVAFTSFAFAIAREFFTIAREGQKVQKARNNISYLRANKMQDGKSFSPH